MRELSPRDKIKSAYYTIVFRIWQGGKIALFLGKKSLYFPLASFLQSRYTMVILFLVIADF